MTILNAWQNAVWHLRLAVENAKQFNLGLAQHHYEQSLADTAVASNSGLVPDKSNLKELKMLQTSVSNMIEEMRNAARPFFDDQVLSPW